MKLMIWLMEVWREGDEMSMSCLMAMQIAPLQSLCEGAQIDEVLMPQVVATSRYATIDKVDGACVASDGTRPSVRGLACKCAREKAEMG